MAQTQWVEYIRNHVDANGGNITVKQAKELHRKLKDELPPKPIEGKAIYEMSENLGWACDEFLDETYPESSLVEITNGEYSYIMTDSLSRDCYAQGVKIMKEKGCSPKDIAAFEDSGEYENGDYKLRIE